MTMNYIPNHKDALAVIFQVDLSQGDFTTLMNVLNENLQEGAAKTSQDQISSDTLKDENATVSQGIYLLFDISLYKSCL